VSMVEKGRMSRDVEVHYETMVTVIFPCGWRVGPSSSALRQMFACPCGCMFVDVKTDGEQKSDMPSDPGAPKTSQLFDPP
jgi:hypothetical protein